MTRMVQCVYRRGWPVMTGTAHEVAEFLGTEVGNVYSRASRFDPRRDSGIVRVEPEEVDAR